MPLRLGASRGLARSSPSAGPCWGPRGPQRPESLCCHVASQLTVHVGLDAAAKTIVLEQRGQNRGFREADIRGFRPEGSACVLGGPEVIESRVNMKAASRRVAVEGVEVASSRDAGSCVLPRR